MTSGSSKKSPASSSRVDKLLDRLGKAGFISTPDLTKGYWQVPLTPDSKEKTAFSTPSGHWHYRVLPFGLHGAPATFQRKMDILLRPHQAYIAANVDEVVIHSESWEDRLEQLRRVLSELRQAGTWFWPKLSTWVIRLGGDGLNLKKRRWKPSGKPSDPPPKPRYEPFWD